MKNKKARSGFAKSLFIALMASSVFTAWMATPSEAQQVQANGSTNTQVYTAPNGVTVVDIANPNASGMSHNTFNHYNVPTNGLVLNNGNVLQMSRQSELAGQVMANMNLTNEANLILNEVVAPNRSMLQGYTEVLGKKADVIVANPYGITCNGCGFINVPNATLTTGVPQITAGALTGFRIDNGDILVTGTGLNAANQDYLGLLARSIKLDGQINAKDLDVVAGANDWDVNTKTATPRTPTGIAPTVAIDSSALGGMYANRIRLIATESGVGVKMLGSAAAGVGDFTLTSSGKIEVGSAISAKRDVKINTSATGANAIKATNAKISAKRDVEISATAGEIRLEGGLITAENNLDLISSSLNDSATSDPMADNNKRYAINNFTLTQTGAGAIDGTTYGAGANFGATLASLTVGSSGATIYSTSGFTLTTTGDMLLGAAKLKNAGNIALASTGGDVTLATGGAVQSTAGTLSISAGDRFENNGGTLSSDTSSVALRAANYIGNTGSIYAKTALSLADAAGGSTQAIENSGTMIADATLTVKGASLNNTGTGALQGATGANSIAITGTLTNASGAKIIASTTGGTATIAADTITNSGIIQSAGLMGVNIASTLTNNAGAKIIGTGGVNVRGSDSAYTINNSGTIQSGGQLSLRGQSDGTGVTVNGLGGSAVFLGNSVDINADTVSLASGSGITAQNGLTLSAATLSMLGSASKVINSAGNATVSLTNAFTNNGLMYSGGNLTLNGYTITNASTGGIAASGTLDVNSTGSVYNDGAFYAGSLLDISAPSEIYNHATGTMDSGQDMAFTSNVFRNRNDINANRNITITTDNFYNEIEGGDTRSTTTTTPVTVDGGWEGGALGSTDPTWLLPFESTNRRFTQTWSDVQSYGTTPTAAMRARLIAGTTLTVTGFNYGLNLGSIMSAGTVNLTGDLGSTFTNDAYDITTINYTKKWHHYAYCCTDVIYIGYTYNIQDGTTSANVTTAGPGASIYAGTLNATGFGLTNAGSALAANVDTTSGTGATMTTGATTTTFGGVTITLPSNPNGFFVVSQNPNSGYLIETNPLYGANSPLGSQYMIDRLGLNPETTQKRLGDGNYEQSLIRDQLTSQVGNAIITPGEDEAAQMQRLMDNGVNVAGALGLKYGEALTPEQAANLSTDMVWMVETEVMGQKVLAPVVYLSAATKAGFAGGAAIVGNDVNMDLASVTN
ncbi:MAG: hypothetical protein K0R10_1552, partial [Alphaproteobacteria bacterium]|nr:hypothetical protein [Alphaproteobacteria bacterium]